MACQKCKARNAQRQAQALTNYALFTSTVDVGVSPEMVTAKARENVKIHTEHYGNFHVGAGQGIRLPLAVYQDLVNNGAQLWV